MNYIKLIDMKKSLYILLTIMLVFASCESFLEEDPRSSATAVGQFSTEQGQMQLVNACYVSLKIWYAKEEGYDMSDVGVDIWTYAEQVPDPDFFEFGPNRSSRKGRLALLWVEFYRGLNTCNTALEVIGESDLFTEEEQAIYLAEIHFLRAMYLYHLTEMWGRIDMPLESTKGVITTIDLVDVSEVYDQILIDLKYAVENLSDDVNTADSEFGRVTKDAALAFRARVNFTIACYIHYAGNTPPYNFPGKSAAEYFDKAYNDAKEVIDSENYSFYDDYYDLWTLENNSTNRNDEGIWAVNYSRTQFSMLNVDASIYQTYTSGVKAYDEREGGHHGHLMWGMEYRLAPGMARVLEYGRTFRRYMPTAYMIELLEDRTEYDARFHGQWRTVWLAVSDVAIVYPKWGNYELPDGTAYVPDSLEEGDVIYGIGDTALVITLDDVPNDIMAIATVGTELYLNVEKGYFMFDKELMYNSDGTINYDGTIQRQMYIQPYKFDDPERTEPDGEGSERGIRDAYVFRLAEMYLIAAEAAARGSQGEGVARDLLKEYRRSRANDGYESVMEDEIDAATLDKVFFLEERAREFIGEQLRWFDLKRTHTPQQWVDWVSGKNPDTRENLKTYHYMYPYPSPEIDAVENKEEFGNNNGYGM
jgi:hypothetical protein